MHRVVLGVAALLLVLPAELRAAEPAHAVVFFSSWSALIDKSAQDAIAEMAGKATARPGDRLALTGYASTVGSNAANTLLAELRAQVVLDQLVADGVPAERITLRSVGATNFVLDALESRRVEITLGEK